MKEYISLLFAVCGLSGVVGALAPEGQTKKYLEIICSLCVICAICVPLVNALSGDISLNDLFDAEYDTESNKYDEFYNNYLSDGYIKEAECSLAEDLERECGAASGSLTVRLDCTSADGKITPISASVIISPRAIAVSPDKIKEYVTKIANIDCIIIYGK